MQILNWALSLFGFGIIKVSIWRGRRESWDTPLDEVRYRIGRIVRRSSNR